MVSYAKSIKNITIQIEAIDFEPSMKFKNLLEIILDKIQKLKSEAGILVLVDMPPLSSLGEFIMSQTQIKCKVISSITLKGLLDVIDKCETGIPITSFVTSSYSKSREESIITTDLNSQFVERINNEYLSENLSFINLKKA